MTDTPKGPIKCTRCKCWRKPKKFIQKNTGRKLKTCKKCRKRDKKSRDKNKCEHNKRKYRCKACGGVSICEHNKRNTECKRCTDPKKLTFSRWIKHFKHSDKKYNRYDANNFIDFCFLYTLVEENDVPICIYCSCELQFIECNNTLVTIERIDNNIGHIKSNCVLACYSCNITRGNRYTFEEYKAKFTNKNT